ncbi:MAG: hypothetical protein B7Z68_06025 [Acidobacteria bacterium 21-70-11]|nr:MAG: hypothetical protein B7Z68_06025 [Acidobacteria bacterium 21-70-11]
MIPRGIGRIYQSSGAAGFARLAAGPLSAARLHAPSCNALPIGGAFDFSGVIPANAGIQGVAFVRRRLGSRLRGNDDKWRLRGLRPAQPHRTTDYIFPVPGARTPGS